MEAERIRFVLQRDGELKAREFASRTFRIYRKCVLMNGKNGRKFHHASLREFRRGFVESYLCFKRFAGNK